MRICVVSQQLKNVYSGVGLHTKLLVDDLISKGHDLTVIVPEKEKPIIQAPYKIITIPSPRFINSQARWLELSPKFSKILHSLEKKSGFDLVHFTDFRDSLFCRTTSPMIANVNDTYTAELKSLSYYREHYFDWFQRFIYYRAAHFFESRRLLELDAVITNSQFTYKTIKKAYGVEDKRLFKCYKAVNYSRYAELAKDRLSQPKLNHGNRILFVGGNMQRKGVLDLIRSAPVIQRAIPDVRFMIAGKDKYITKYKQLCKELGVSQNFIFLGWVSQEDLLYLYKSASCFIMPSLTEALGVVFLEAMSAAIPVIGTDVGGISEIIKDSNNGLLVPVNDPLAIAEAAIKILTDEDFSKRLVINGIETVKQFSVEKMMACVEDIYRSVLKSKFK